jgi:hypothetical protein
MVHVDKSEGAQTCVKQVEFNTIASSFGGLSSRVAGLHRNLQSIDAYPDALKPIINDQSLPESTSIPKLALGLAKAHAAYTASSSPSQSTCVLFIVQDTPSVPSASHSIGYSTILAWIRLPASFFTLLLTLLTSHTKSQRSTSARVTRPLTTLPRSTGQPACTSKEALP